MFASSFARQLYEGGKPAYKMTRNRIKNKETYLKFKEGVDHVFVWFNVKNSNHIKTIGEFKHANLMTVQKALENVIGKEKLEKMMQANLKKEEEIMEESLDSTATGQLEMKWKLNEP